MSFQMPDEQAPRTPDSPAGKVRLTPRQIVYVALGLVALLAGIIMWIAGEPLGYSDELHGAGFTTTFPDYGRLLLILLGMVLLSIGLFRNKRKNQHY